jgi:type I restriction enzyme S subunit
MTATKQVAEMNPQYAAQSVSQTVPEGYKRTEVGMIPEDWDVLTLEKIASYRNGAAHENCIDESGVYVVVNSKFISTEGEIRKVSNECRQPAFLDEILMVMSDVPNGRAIAKCYLVDENNKYTVNQRICALKAQKVVPKYLFYKLNRNPFYLAFDDGAKQTNLRRQDVLDCPLPIPKYEEQISIANALSDVDALIIELEKLIAKKKAIKTATMQQLLIGRTRLSQFVLREDGTPKGYKQSVLGEIPEDWEVIALSQLVLSHNAGVYKPKSLYGSGTNIVGVGDIYDINKVDGAIFRKVPLTEEEKKIFLLEEGDLIYGESSLVREGIARTVYVDAGGTGTAFAWHTRRYKVNCEKIDSKYLYYFLASSSGRTHMINNSITTALTGINTVAYFSCSIFLPQKREQIAIATILSDIDEEIRILEQRLTKTRQIKQGMMQELLMGKTRLIKEKPHD